MKNPFAETIACPAGEYPELLRNFWSALPESNCGYWNTEFVCDVDPAMREIKKLEVMLRDAKKHATTCCEELGGRMWTTACDQWSEEAAKKALEECV